jgi:DNA-binding transcriptional regulator YiaG
MMKKRQEEVFSQLSATFPAEVLQTWRAMVEAWEKNPKAPNPYAEPRSSEN